MLVQTVGYELENEFDNVFYEDLANISDRMLFWHHTTDQGDEYTLTECITTVDKLVKESGQEQTSTHHL